MNERTIDQANRIKSITATFDSIRQEVKYSHLQHQMSQAKTYSEVKKIHDTIKTNDKDGFHDKLLLQTPLTTIPPDKEGRTKIPQDRPVGFRAQHEAM